MHTLLRVYVREDKVKAMHLALGAEGGEVWDSLYSCGISFTQSQICPSPAQMTPTLRVDRSVVPAAWLCARSYTLQQAPQLDSMD